AGDDVTFEAVVSGVPAAGVTYQWVLTTPLQDTWLFNPDQTTAQVVAPRISIPDFGNKTCSLTLTVTPRNGSPAVTVTSAIRYIDSVLTVGSATTILALGPQV